MCAMRFPVDPPCGFQSPSAQQRSPVGRAAREASAVADEPHPFDVASLSLFSRAARGGGPGA